MKSSKTIHKVGLLVESNGTFLAVRKKDSSWWLFPGGKQEEGEDNVSCLQRELQEELNVRVTDIKFFATHQSPAVHEPDTVVVVDVYTGSLVGEPRASSEIASFGWITADDPQCSPVLHQALSHYLRKHHPES